MTTKSSEAFVRPIFVRSISKYARTIIIIRELYILLPVLSVLSPDLWSFWPFLPRASGIGIALEVLVAVTEIVT